MSSKIMQSKLVLASLGWSDLTHHSIFEEIWDECLDRLLWACLHDEQIHITLFLQLVTIEHVVMLAPNKGFLLLFDFAFRRISLFHELHVCLRSETPENVGLFSSIHALHLVNNGIRIDVLVSSLSNATLLVWIVALQKDMLHINRFIWHCNGCIIEIIPQQEFSPGTNLLRHSNNTGHDIHNLLNFFLESGVIVDHKQVRMSNVDLSQLFVNHL
mmetsp:Transcript_5962/g.22629  ORF Transcript_5962/g.22629 Transcript_5962/m.22629 type:complete len:215 (+) Transcript_5962:54-698(+)